MNCASVRHAEVNPVGDLTRVGVAGWIRGLPAAKNFRLAVERDLQPATLLTGETFQDIDALWRPIIRQDAS